MTGAFLDAFQKVADMATGTRGRHTHAHLHTHMHKENVVNGQQQTCAEPMQIQPCFSADVYIVCFFY